MNNRRRLIVIILIVITALLGGVSILLSQLLQQNQSTPDSSAGGFGQAANREFYDDFTSEFRGRGCFGLLSNPLVQAYTPETFEEIRDLDLRIQNFNPESGVPVKCNIYVDDSSTKYIDMTVHTYNATSVIDPTANALFARVNSNIINILTKSDAKNTSFFFGTDVSDSDSCRANIFNQNNDFEYISVKYVGFNQPCSELTELNDQVVYVVDKQVKLIIDEIVK